MTNALHWVWDRLSVYLPLFLMAVLALGTYWLVRSTPTLPAAEVRSAANHVPDYFLSKFAVKTFDAQGRLKSEVFGQDARHYPDTDTLEIDQVRIRSFDTQGRLTTATARRALANGDASEVQLFGDATVLRDAFVVPSGAVLPRTEFRSEFLHAFMNLERFKSNKPVRLVRGRDEFSADSMDYDNLDRVLKLDGRVKATLTPAGAR